MQLLLLAFSIGYFAIITSFPHVHEEGGRILVHAHPFSDNKDSGNPLHNSPSHGLQQTCNLLFVQVNNVVLIQQIETGYKYWAENYQILLSFELTLPYSLRAPPVC